MNAYVAAIETRIALAKSENKLSASNVKKLETAKARLSNDKLVAFLEKNEVTTDFANKNVYMIEKLVNYVMNANALSSDFNEMNKYIFLTAKRCAEEKETMTLKDAQDACSSDRLIDDTRKHLVVQRRAIASADTVKAQHNSSMSALIELNILKSVARDSREKHFAVNAKNTIYKALVKNLSA